MTFVEWFLRRTGLDRQEDANPDEDAIELNSSTSIDANGSVGTEIDEPLLPNASTSGRDIHFDEAYVASFVNLGLWSALLLGGYAATRLLVYIHVPADGQRERDVHQVYSDVIKLLQFGVVTFFFTQLHRPERASWLFDWDQKRAAVAYALTPLLYGVASNIPSLQESINTIWRWGILMWLVAVTGLTVAVYTIVVHCRLAIQQKTRPALLMFLASRLVVLGGCALMAVLMETFSQYHSMHLHHYFLGWAVGLFAEFNHPASAMTLAICQGIFVQGIGAYSFDKTFNNANCYSLTAVDRATCTIALTDQTLRNTTLRVELCPQPGAPPVELDCK